MINEVGKTFMSNGIEYRITYINEPKKRMTIEPIEKKSRLPILNQLFIIDTEKYKVTYINDGQKRISLEQIG